MIALSPSLRQRLTKEAERRGLQIVRTVPKAPEYFDWLRSIRRPGYDYSARHFEAIGAQMQRVVSGEIDRLRIHMPPRHGKTEAVTVPLPVYLATHFRGSRILVTGYNERFARKLSRKSRTLAVELGIELSGDKTATDEWQTSDGSLVMARGVGSPPTGEGFDYIVIDDPIRRRQDAESLVYRDALWDWYTDDLYTRLQPDGRMIGIWTLWHEDDLAGRLKAQYETAMESGDGADDWSVLTLAAIAGDDDPIGRKPGEALWPEMWPVEKLERRKQVMTKAEGLRSWEALYQQNPTPQTGDVFNTLRLGLVDAAPSGLPTSRAWDVGASANTGDYTVGVKMAGPDSEGLYYVLDVRRFRSDTGERDAAILQTAELDGKACRIGLPKDPAAAGKAQVAYWARQLAGFRFQEMPTSSDKLTRAGPFSSQVNVGNVMIVRGRWNAEYVEELRTFPGVNDDQVDASSDAFSLLARPKTTWQVY